MGPPHVSGRPQSTRSGPEIPENGGAHVWFSWRSRRESGALHQAVTLLNGQWQVSGVGVSLLCSRPPSPSCRPAVVGQRLPPPANPRDPGSVVRPPRSSQGREH